MNSKQTVIIGAIATLAIGIGIAILRLEKTASEGGHGDESAKEEVIKGPHRGRLLSEGDFQIEATIFETNVPPVFRFFTYDGGKPLDPSEVSVIATVHRLGRVVDTVQFKKEGEYLAGDKVVYEPHSFTVAVSADWKGKNHLWEYTQLEGRLTLPQTAWQSSGVTVETAGPATIRSTLILNGKIVPNEDRMVHLRARYPGVIRETRKRLGDAVKQGEVLAVVESNESLQPYELKAQIAGTVIEKHAAPGEAVSESQSIYTVADLSTVWVDMSVYRKDFPRLRKGQSVSVDAGDGGESARTAIAYLSPFGAENTQTMLARAVLKNPRGDWRPGLFVKADVTLEEVEVPLAVKAEALQTFRDWEVVFLRDGDLFEARPLELGRRDSEWLEVLSGIKAGNEYGSGNSFLLKAELGKAGATHDH